MLLGGLWHGAGWGFVVWGGLHGAYLTINHIWRRQNYSLPSYLAGTITFAAVVIAWVFFRADGFEQASAILTAMFGGGSDPFAVDLVSSDPAMFYPAMLLLPCAAFITWGGIDAMSLSEQLASTKYGALILACLAAVSIAMIFSAGSYEFIYFQF
jgi:alginate O-acetyltransferase complex protein AlgI